MPKVAIITGSGSGIGSAVALSLAGKGYSILINYSSNVRGAEATREQCDRLGADSFLFCGDVRDDAACRNMVSAAIARWGQVDALINNAGITSFHGLDKWDSLDASTFQDIYSVNAVGPFQMVRACAPYLKQTRGCVVNVSSAAGIMGRGSSVPYIMSKGALNSLTLYLARTLAPDVRVNAVCPGLVTSNWFRKGLGSEGFERIREKFERESPLQRASEPEDVADAVVWLIEAAKTMTGELLLLDSGRHLG